MSVTILDCYTDEPSGLGVPPYLGVYPRYIAGELENPYYITIDDLRAFIRPELKGIKVHNLTNNSPNLQKILDKTKELIVIAGVHTPGKYLSAAPGTLFEIRNLVSGLKCRKILTGPAVHGTRSEGGKFAEKIDLNFFDEIRQLEPDYETLKSTAIKGSSIVEQIPHPIIAEIETGRGCPRKSFCSFCLEPRHRVEWREQKDIYNEVKALKSYGVKYFRLGKQSCFYSYKGGNPDEIEKLLKPISELNPEILHIDNVNPQKVVGADGKQITKLIVKYCTPGNVAAFGVESFDEAVIKANNLNTNPEEVYKAVEILNKYGSQRGDNGMPNFLPGINILFGLNKESKKTHEENMLWLRKILQDNLLLRRINIRQVVPFDGTALHNECGNKYLRKNNRYYWKWRNQIRQEIDFPMLKKLLPEGTVMKNVYAEIHDGNNTFGRQFGTYPLVVGVTKKLELNKFYNLRITGHMLRSVTGEVI